MRRFGRRDLEDFLRAVDAHLVKPVAIVLIGGAVVGLRFKGTHFTADIDLWERADAAFWEAVEKANAGHAAPIPVQAVTIGDAPRTFEDRLVLHEIAGLSSLAVYVPEAHDLAIMKVSRGAAHDLDAIEDIHRAVRLDLETLVARYQETDWIGDARLNFLSAVGRLFGEDAAHTTDGRLRK